ncbi:MAG: phosphotransferase, partial [Eubacteriales bacterium]|nr:phosphotransferase [Eubacteriales bacterium]
RTGDTVRRQVKGGPMVHAYLLYLEEAGMAGVPRFRGLDEQGREILTYLPGQTQGHGLPLGHPWLLSEESIAGAAVFLRRLHDVSAGFLPEALARGWFNPTHPHEPCDTICHNDAAIWNFVFTDGEITGLIDFDQACAGQRIWDVAWSVYGTAHLHPWAAAEKYAPSRHAAFYKRRIRLYFDAYGLPCPPDFIDIVCRRIRIGVCDDLKNGAARGDETSLRLIQQGALAHYEKVAAFIQAYGHDWI